MNEYGYDGGLERFGSPRVSLGDFALRAIILYLQIPSALCMDCVK